MSHFFDASMEIPNEGTLHIAGSHQTRSASISALFAPGWEAILPTCYAP